MMDNKLAGQLARLETSRLLTQLTLGALIVFLTIRFWGIEMLAHVVFIPSLVLVAIWCLLRVFVSALRRKPGWSGDDDEM
jgi:uncharacterized membrane protein YqgA involved in biofilm formation